jgi:CheY-like chemotaxis protein
MRSSNQARGGAVTLPSAPGLSTRNEPLMNSTDQGSSGGLRVLVVEDEILIGMLLEDMLRELGHQIVAIAPRVGEAVEVANSAAIDAAILDVNVNGEEVFPVAEVLLGRGVPFVFATGYGDRAMPELFRNRPTLQKPFQMNDLEQALAKIASSPA